MINYDCIEMWLKMGDWVIMYKVLKNTLIFLLYIQYKLCTGVVTNFHGNTVQSDLLSLKCFCQLGKAKLVYRVYLN